MAVCECHIAAEFPILGSLGIISASLRSGTDISIVETACGTQIALTGATRGDLSITAYAPGPVVNCPGNASVNFNWETRMSCKDGDLKLYAIPKGSARASVDGSVTTQISLLQIGNSYQTFNASASSGPQTPYLVSNHVDGYDFYYSGNPLSVSPEDGKSAKSVSFLQGILPNGSELYLTSFGWSYTPPNIPTVSYSFIFVYNQGG